MNTNEPKFVTAEIISEDLDVSKSQAYKIIQSLNRQLKAEHPNAIIIAGRVNRKWYNEALLDTDKNVQREYH